MTEKQKGAAIVILRRVEKIQENLKLVMSIGHIHEVLTVLERNRLIDVRNCMDELSDALEKRATEKIRDNK